MNLESIIRPNIIQAKAYSSARDEYSNSEGIFLDANENPFGELNRYPDPRQRQVKEKIAAIKEVSPDQIFIGNGSDEIIDLSFRIFCRPGQDKAICFYPTYGMYEVSAQINDIELLQLPLTKGFEIDTTSLRPFLLDSEYKLLFLCTPNNPTGNITSIETIKELASNFHGILIIDEAYLDFAQSESAIQLIKNFNNILVMQTMSKAWGLAAARLGVAYGQKELLFWYNKIKPPYNISSLNQRAALKALESQHKNREEVQEIISERERLSKAFENFSWIYEIFPSKGNFILIRVDDANLRYQMFLDNKIVVRNRDSQIKNTLRITVGSKEENNQLLDSIKEWK